jgi:hypothetical protein
MRPIRRQDSNATINPAVITDLYPRSRMTPQFNPSTKLNVIPNGNV